MGWRDHIKQEALLCEDEEEFEEDQYGLLEVGEALTQLEALQAAQAAGPTTASLEDRFAAVSEAVRTLRGASNDDKLRLYSLYKQALEGDCATKAPGMFDFAGAAKWKAWKSLAGTPAPAAMEQYVTFANELLAR
eukprot:NODE_6217_length_464_cov_223.173494_g4708_i0.p2 GENE.NODE_6217_length_464_cov_223.173494_g4708_i0~~NODE_6217_length_464_cov_223.173494_g4708_i0.p2  ORF type:complete len:143 (-),score=64.69 NODE_6217_length_464_cov_223.173494_g4708_i0:35-439(-)